ncbi:MAG TPA: 3-deoxy-7-phosphoheptulonate synthase, partial [Candidatus Caenarcaniphilales bacterium]
GHLVLRGGKHGPNYEAAHVEKAALELAKHGLNARMMVDCSHDNSSKDDTRQPAVLQDIAEQLAAGAQHLMGVMIESHLVAGKQSFPKDIKALVYGQSITDACVDFETTTSMLRTLAEAVATGRLQASYVC